jgi:hypothetical protein
MEDQDVKNRLEKILGVKECHEVLRLLSALKEGIKENSGKDIDRVAKILNRKIPQIDYRYKQLTANIDDPMEKVKILGYLVRSVANLL